MKQHISRDGAAAPTATRPLQRGLVACIVALVLAMWLAYPARAVSAGWTQALTLLIPVLFLTISLCIFGLARARIRADTARGTAGHAPLTR